jgi:hypothetical protein
MLINVVELAQGNERSSVPSIVGLYSISKELTKVVRGISFQSAIDGRIKLLPIPQSWKLAVLGRFENKGPHNVVECAAQIVECIANNESQVLIEDLSGFDFEDITAGIRVVIDVNNVRVDLWPV